MNTNRVRIRITSIFAIALFIGAASTAVAQQNAIRLEDPGTGQGITWWVVGSGGVLGAGSQQGDLLSATVGQTAIDKVEYRSSDGRLYPAMTTYLGYWLPGSGSLNTSDVPGMTPPSENGMQVASHPNPLTTETVISYQLPVSGHVRLSIYDVNGRQVRQLFDGNQEAGTHRVNWNALDDAGAVLASGIYIYTIELLGTTGTVEGTGTTARGILYLVK